MSTAASTGQPDLSERHHPTAHRAYLASDRSIPIRGRDATAAGQGCSLSYAANDHTQTLSGELRT
jgi:hypothetical protein